MKRTYIVAIAAVLCALCWITSGSAAPFFAPNDRVIRVDNSVGRAFKDGTSDVQVEGAGTLIRLLPDDLNGDRHQRFIVGLSSGQTVLIAHNIDIAPKVAGLQRGDSVRFYGEYEWNEKGGLVHWTHRDPKGHHIAGWLKHNGKTYQ